MASELISNCNSAPNPSRGFLNYALLPLNAARTNYTAPKKTPKSTAGFKGMRDADWLENRTRDNRRRYVFR